MGFIISLLVLSLLIFFHELGHFFAARFFGVHVDVFSIGFGKKIVSKKIGDTEWRLSAVPLGGYVKMKGQDDSDPTKISFDDDSYNMKKPWQRIIILFAGPFANFFTAFMLYFAISQIGTPLSPLFDFTRYIPAKVGGFTEDSPAKAAGLDINDTIIKINDISIKNWGEVGEVIQSQEESLHLTIDRKGMQKQFTFSPIIATQTNKFGEDVKRKLIGIGPSIPEEKLSFSFSEGLQFAYNETLYASGLIYQSLEKLITGAIGADKLGGVITIVDITAKASDAGIIVLFLFTALISVNLGVLNLLPIPALDGGHIMFNLYEMIRGKAPSENVLYRLTVIGWTILFGLMFVGLFNDINRLWG
ncbi:MAG: RIP metalloprotease RseP [Campylobacterales bacterium]|nr:RIP metalloprotease RseP [Campylobacterales bacterium]